MYTYALCVVFSLYSVQLVSVYYVCVFLYTKFSIPLLGELFWHAIAIAFNIPWLLHWIHIFHLWKSLHLFNAHCTGTLTLPTWVDIRTQSVCIHIELREFYAHSSTNAIGIAITLSPALFLRLTHSLVLNRSWCEWVCHWTMQKPLSKNSLSLARYKTAQTQR